MPTNVGDQHMVKSAGLECAQLDANGWPLFAMLWCNVLLALLVLMVLRSSLSYHTRTNLTMVKNSI
jgi:hypothetical protein